MNGQKNLNYILSLNTKRRCRLLLNTCRAYDRAEEMSCAYDEDREVRTVPQLDIKIIALLIFAKFHQRSKLFKNTAL